MQKILLALCSILFLSVAISQSLKKYDIAKSGCSVYMFCAPGQFEESYSEDSSKVYKAECEMDAVQYGAICVKFRNSITDLQTAEDLLTSYLDYLKVSFKIVSAAGYGKGHHLKDRKNTSGIIDYWTDDEKNNWKVKGWTDGSFIAVLYAYSKKELPETKINLFLDGFRLPGM